MKKMILLCPLLIFCVLALLGFHYLHAGSSGETAVADFEILARRGVHPIWQGRETHTQRPWHPYLENTIEALEAAFAFGATIVEIDIRRTRDGHLVIFRDSDLSRRTNGQGLVEKRPLRYLKNLDIGYGYTFDNGNTFPFRGRGVGKLPTLAEVLQRFPDKRFLLHHRDGLQGTANILISLIRNFTPEQQERLCYLGSAETHAYIRKYVPHIGRLLSTREETNDFLSTHLYSAGLRLPERHTGTSMVLSRKQTRYLWGWPYRFLRAARENNCKVYLEINTLDDVRWMKDIPVNGVVTDSIDIIGPHFRSRARAAPAIAGGMDRNGTLPLTEQQNHTRQGHDGQESLNGYDPGHEIMVAPHLTGENE